MNDIQIIHGISSKDEAAINYTINKYSKLIWHIASTVLKNAASVQDIEECSADVFIYLWNNPGRFNKQRGTLKTWLCMIAKSKAIDKYRQLSRTNEITLNDESLTNSLDILDAVITGEQRRELIAAVNALGDPDKEIVIRRYYYQQKPKEISFILDLPVKQIENRLYRSRLRLREMILTEGRYSYEKQ